MKVLIDFVGHADLYWALHALFENRLGWELYRPDGLDPEWQTFGVFTPHANGERLGNKIKIPTHDFYEQKLITLKDFLDSDFQLVVSSSHTNEEPLFNILSYYKLDIPFVRYVGNIGELPVRAEHCLMAQLTPAPTSLNVIHMHPEQLPRYSPDEAYNPNFTIKSFSNYLPSFPEDIRDWELAKHILHEYTFLMHGANCHDGPIPQQDLANVMRDSMFVWHTKGHGSCGFVAREAMFCGKILIVKKKHAVIYKTLAQEYLQDMVNCIDLSVPSRTLQDNMEIIREWSKPDIYSEKCRIAYEFTKSKINFEQEALLILDWFSRFVDIS